MKFNKNTAVEQSFEELLLPSIGQALERGSTLHQDAWLEHIDEDLSDFENVKHVIDVHVQIKILQALVALDHGDIDGFTDYLGSAVGYMANAVLKANYLAGSIGLLED